MGRAQTLLQVVRRTALTKSSCLQAADDPIAPIEGCPNEAIKANPLCLLAITPTGGHLGWCRPGSVTGEPYTDRVTSEYFKAILPTVLEERARHPEKGVPEEAAGVSSLGMTTKQAP